MTVEPRRIDLDALLNAHAFMRVERPSQLWEVDVDDVTNRSSGCWES